MSCDLTVVVDEDKTLAALEALLEAGRENVVAWMQLMEHAGEIRELRRRGVSYKDISLPHGVPVIEAVNANQKRLSEAAGQFRRAAMLELRAEGLSIADIARAFGVSRQRVSNVLAGLATSVDGDGECDPDTEVDSAQA